MALVLRGKSECPLCGGVIQEQEAVVAAPHFIGDPRHPWHRLSDAGMHEACFTRWEHREEFVALYNRTIGRNAPRWQLPEL